MTAGRDHPAGDAAARREFASKAIKTLAKIVSISTQQRCRSPDFDSVAFRNPGATFSPTGMNLPRQIESDHDA